MTESVKATEEETTRECLKAPRHRTKLQFTSSVVSKALSEQASEFTLIRNSEVKMWRYVLTGHTWNRDSSETTKLIRYPKVIGQKVRTSSRRQPGQSRVLRPTPVAEGWSSIAHFALPQISLRTDFEVLNAACVTQVISNCQIKAWSPSQSSET